MVESEVLHAAGNPLNDPPNQAVIMLLYWCKTCLAQFGRKKHKPPEPVNQAWFGGLDRSPPYDRKQPLAKHRRDGKLHRVHRCGLLVGQLKIWSIYSREDVKSEAVDMSEVDWMQRTCFHLVVKVHTCPHLAHRWPQATTRLFSSLFYPSPPRCKSIEMIANGTVRLCIHHSRKRSESRWTVCDHWETPGA